jgi:predicted peptidase
MNISLRPVVAASLVWVLAASSARPAEPATKLVPGNTITVQYPEMPSTFHAVFQKTNVKAQMSIFLPTNYDPGKKFPLFIFLNGGDGGVGGNPGVARSLCEGRDFVCVSVPLFKAPDFKVTETNVPGAGFIMSAEDARYMWPFFKIMLANLEALVPNTDPAHRLLGGFSNGAHAIAGLIDESDGEIARRFSAFLFIEGGGKLQHYDLLKGKPFLMVSSNAKSQPRAQQICDAANVAGAKAALVVEDVGKHDFPMSAYPAVRKWLRGPAME